MAEVTNDFLAGMIGSRFKTLAKEIGGVSGRMKSLQEEIERAMIGAIVGPEKAPEDRAAEWPVVVARFGKPDSECGFRHWFAYPLDWQDTRKPDGDLAGAWPDAEGCSEVEALEGCRREMADFFRAGYEPVP